MEEHCSIQLNADFLESVQVKEEILEPDTLSDGELQEFATFLKPKICGFKGSNKLVECSLCFKHLKESSLKQHIKTHIGLKPYPCSFCNSKFTRKGDVSRHVATMHRMQSPKFTCSLCGKTFFEKNLYISHLNGHNKQCYFNCKLCHTKFTKREYYNDHVKYGNCHSKSKKDATDSYDWKTFDCVTEKRNQPEGNVGSEPHLQVTPMADKPQDIILGNISKYSNPNNASNSCNDIDSSSICKIKLSPVKMECSHGDQITTAINTAIHQSEEAIKGIQQRMAATLLASNKARHLISPYSKNPPTKIQITAVIEGRIETFTIELPSRIKCDASTPSGMKTVLNLVTNLCSEKGRVDGEIDVKIINKLH